MFFMEIGERHSEDNQRARLSLLWTEGCVDDEFFTEVPLCDDGVLVLTVKLGDIPTAYEQGFGEGDDVQMRGNVSCNHKTSQN